MTSPRWPVVLFDLDGTLVDTINLIVTSYQHAFRTVIGREWDEAEIKSWIGTSLIGAMHRAVGPELGDELFRVYTEFNEANTEKLIKGYDGVPALVADLKAAGVRMGIATSKRREPAEWALRLCGLDVPVLVAHEDVAEHKPNPAALGAALVVLDATVDDAVYVGDAAVDIQASRNAGWPVIAVTWGAGVRQELESAKPDYLCDSVDDLRGVLFV